MLSSERCRRRFILKRRLWRQMQRIPETAPWYALFRKDKPADCDTVMSCFTMKCFWLSSASNSTPGIALMVCCKARWQADSTICPSSVWHLHRTMASDADHQFQIASWFEPGSKILRRMENVCYCQWPHRRRFVDLLSSSNVRIRRLHPSRNQGPEQANRRSSTEEVLTGLQTFERQSTQVCQTQKLRCWKKRREIDFRSPGERQSSCSYSSAERDRRSAREEHLRKDTDRGSCFESISAGEALPPKS